MRIMRSTAMQHRVAAKFAGFALLCVCMPSLVAQSTPPVTDSSAQASPAMPAPAAPVTDAAAQASPAPGLRTGGVSIAPHTAVTVRLPIAIDSGHLTNGQTLRATLAAPIALSPGRALPVGTPVEMTVVETVAAGRISSAGELSLQALQVGSIPVYTDTLTFRGRPGHKDVPDAVPAVGTDARLPAGAELTFHVLPPAAPATGPPRTSGTSSGSERGNASRERAPSQPQRGPG